MQKLALLSPAVNAGQAPPTEDAQRAAFEQQFGQMAYQAFSAKFPDIMNDVVTFKVLDTDLENSTAVGAFVIERNGEFIYAPAVLSDNQLKPFDLMYAKSKDIFLPLTTDWLDELGKTTLASLGEGAKLPETVATDVDIRNIVVPPTTGRYSYASADVSPYARLHAEASRPLEKRLLKIANNGMGGGIVGSGSVSDADYNPEIWSTFVDQFGRIHQSTPGQALDNGTLDLETLAKMYKSHMKTWEMTQNPALAQQGAQGQMQGQPGAQPGMAPASPGMPQGVTQPGMGGQPVGTGGATPVGGAGPGMGAMPKMAADFHADAARRAIEEAVASGTHVPYKNLGSKFEDLTTSMGKGGLMGAGTGLLQASSDRKYDDVPEAMLHGAMYGAAGAPIGGMLGKGFAHRNPGAMTPATGSAVGEAVGGIGAGYMGARALPDTLANMAAPSQSALEAYAMQYPDQARFLNRQGSAADITAGFKALLKHASKKASHTPRLLEFLSNAPNTIKTAFARVLDVNPKLLKKAADIYGGDALIASLKLSKTAGMVDEAGGGALYVYDKETPAKKINESFGSAAPEAFNGILMRGYYFKDTRPKLNLAVQAQVYHDFHDARESGVYRIYNLKGEPKAALVINEPFDPMDRPRNVFPTSGDKVKRLKVRGDTDGNHHEPHDMSSFELDHPDADVERSHKLNRCVIFANGDYIDRASKVMGEQVTETVLAKGPLYERVMSDGKAAPARGKGMFLCKRGSHYFGSVPLEITEISTGSDDVIRGKLSGPGGFGGVSFVIDPRSPINRPRRMRDVDLVVIPVTWKWMPLKASLNGEDFLMTAQSLQAVVLDALGSMGVHDIVVRRAGESMYAVNGSKTMDKKAALREIATEYRVHASAAEAMLKIAEVESKCVSYLMRPDQYSNLTYNIKLAQGTGAPMTPMGGPPAMSGPPPAAGPGPAMPTPPGAMAPAPPPTGDPNAAAAPPPPSPIDQAFGEVTGGMQQQISQLQSSLNILMTVQQRAQQISSEQAGGMPPSPPPDFSAAGGAPAGGAPAGAPPPGAPPAGGPAPGGMPPDPSMQGAPPGMGPGMATDPAAAGGAAGGAAPGQPPGAVMATEAPSSQQVAQQVNPNFLNNAATFQDAGAFDAGAIGSLAQNPSLQNIGAQYAPGLENSVDDLGRTLLTLYMQESELKDQLGDDSFVKLETQLRDTFQGLGDLVLTLTHNTSMLHANQPSM